MDVEIVRQMKQLMRNNIAEAEADVRRAEHQLHLRRLELAQFNAANPDPVEAAQA